MLSEPNLFRVWRDQTPVRYKLRLEMNSTGTTEEIHSIWKRHWSQQPKVMSIEHAMIRHISISEWRTLNLGIVHQHTVQDEMDISNSLLKNVLPKLWYGKPEWMEFSREEHNTLNRIEVNDWRAECDERTFPSSKTECWSNVTAVLDWPL